MKLGGLSTFHAGEIREIRIVSGDFSDYTEKDCTRSETKKLIF